MPQFHRRTQAPVVTAATVLFCVFSGPAPEARPLFQPRPGPIDHRLAIAVGDFDRDGLDDLAIAEFQAGVVTILVAQRDALGQPDGTFRPSATSPVGVGTATFSTPTTGPQALVAADLNPSDVDGDTIPNVIDNCPNVANGPEVTAGSQLDANTNGVGDACETLADTDHDGAEDDPIDTDGDGVPNFEPATATLPARLDNCPHFYNPGQEDLTTGSGPDGVCGNFDDVPQLFGPDGKCGGGDDLVGDKVGDACAASPDLIVLTNSLGGGATLGSVRVRLNDGTGGFLNRASLLTGVGPGQVILADVSGDKILDILITSVSIDLVQVFVGTGDGQFNTGNRLVTGNGPQAIVAADIDGDGDLDPITADSLAGTLSLFRNAPGAMALTPSETLDTGGHPAVLLSGSLNGDLLDDVVVLGQGATCVGGPQNQQPCNVNQDCADPDPTKPQGTCTGAGDTGSMQIFTGAPAGASPALVAGPLLPLPQGSQPRAGALRDLNGDNRLDLAVADFSGRQVLIFPGNGDGTFGTASILPINGQPADLAFLTLTPATSSDLAVLDSSGNRVDLFEHGTGFTYAPSPVTPASPWRDANGMALIAADGLVGFDVVLLQNKDARVDVLSGIGDGSFRPTPSFRPKVVADGDTVFGTALTAADFRQDGRPDLAVLDNVNGAGAVTVWTGELNGLLEERGTVSAGGAGAARTDAGPLYESIEDYDRDGVPNTVDDCPGVYNPPGCKVDDALCAPVVPIVCNNTALVPKGCDATANPPQVDPFTGQCDSDRNGIGDLCQVLGADEATPGTCFSVDSDFDLKADYDQNGLKKTATGALDFDGDGIANTGDNCPTFANPGQEDPNNNGVGEACEIISAGQTVDPDGDQVPTWNPLTQQMDNCPAISNPGQEDNDADGVGNACILGAAVDNCLGTPNNNQQDSDGDGLGDACAVPPQDLFIANPATGTIAVLQGDGLGNLRPSSVLTGFSGPLSVRSGHFSLACTAQGAFCQDREKSDTFPGVFDLAVAEAGTPGNSSDDRIALLVGDVSGGFTPLADFPVSGDPSLILRLQDQPVCPIPGSAANPSLRFDTDAKTDLIVALGTGDSTLSVLLPSNQNYLNATLSPLVRPVAFGAALPVSGTLRDVVAANINQDTHQDLIAISSIAGTPTTTTITPFIGMGNGLFFTDPELQTKDLPFDAKFLQSANVDIKRDSFFPDLVLFESRDQAPFSLLNVLPERADIDGSGRVDGYDLALFAMAFGSTRGEDFTLQPDATFLRTGSGPTEVIVRTGSQVPGQDLPNSSGACNVRFDAGAGRYGVPVDINLDGIVDGTDLAFLATRFGSPVR